MRINSSTLLPGYTLAFTFSHTQLTGLSPFQVVELRTELETLHQMNSHLEWHCAMYRKVLNKIPNANQILLKEANSEKKICSSHCNQCEIEQLLSTIQMYKDQLQGMLTSKEVVVQAKVKFLAFF